jgi:hypothetical protein
MTYIQEINKTQENKLELANLILLWAAFYLCPNLRASTWSWHEQLCLKPETMNFFDLYNQDVSSWLCLCGSTWLDWYLRLKKHLLFSITSGTSTPSLPLALLQCMVHRGQVLVDPSSITIMIHTTLCVFNEHTLIDLWNVDVEEYVLMSWTYFVTTIDMTHTSSIHSLLSHFMKFFLSLWH